MNDLRPRRVEAGALSRWFREAGELTRRKLAFWLIATVLFSIICTAATLFQVFFVGIITIAAAAILGISYGVLIAAHADSRMSVRVLWRALCGAQNLRYTGRTWLDFVRRSPVIIIVAIAAGALGSVFPASSSAAEPTLPVVLWTFAFSLLGLLLYLALVNNHPRTHIHRFLAMMLLGTTWADSEVLVIQGFELNQATLTQLSLKANPLGLSTMGAVVMLIFVPFGDTVLAILGVVLFPLISSLFYVSFRDIYLGVAENSPVRAEQRQAALVPTS